MKTIHVMKTLNKAFFAVLFVVPFLLADAATAQAADATAANYQLNPDGSYSVVLPDGTAQVIPAGLATQINAALALGSDVDLSNAIQTIVSTSAGANNTLAAALTGLATSLAPSRGGAIATGGLRGAPNAANQILSTVQNTPGVNFAQVVADVGNDPQIPPETKQASVQQLAGVQPAAGGQDGGDGGDDLITPGEDTAENPAQTVATNPLP